MEKMLEALQLLEKALENCKKELKAAKFAAHKIAIRREIEELKAKIKQYKTSMN